MINQNITEENRITFDNPLKYEYKYSPNIGNHKFSWFYVEDGCLYEKYYCEALECESRRLIEFMEQLPPNMLIGEIDDLQQLMYAFGEGNFDLQY
jgi:hypothetical protein